MGGYYNSLPNFLFENFYNKTLEKFTYLSHFIDDKWYLRDRSGIDWPSVLHLISSDIRFDIHAHCLECSFHKGPVCIFIVPLL